MSKLVNVIVGTSPAGAVMFHTHAWLVLYVACPTLVLMVVPFVEMKEGTEH